MRNRSPVRLLNNKWSSSLHSAKNGLNTIFKNGHKKLATLPIPIEKLTAYGEGM